MDESHTTEDLAAEAVARGTEREQALPEKLSQLRRKLGQQAKQEEPAALPTPTRG